MFEFNWQYTLLIEMRIHIHHSTFQSAILLKIKSTRNLVGTAGELLLLLFQPLRIRKRIETTHMCCYASTHNTTQIVEFCFDSCESLLYSRRHIISERFSFADHCSEIVSLPSSASFYPRCVAIYFNIMYGSDKRQHLDLLVWILWVDRKRYEHPFQRCADHD